MAESTKVAISLDHELFADADRLRKETGESRSAMFARALRALLATEARAAAIAQYTKAYRDKPETAEEVRVIRAASKRALRTVPWDNE
jgi:predicted transcriptional regulator